MTNSVQTQIFPSDDTHIILQGTEEVHREEYEFWGRLVVEFESVVSWSSAFCAETLTPIPLSDWLKNGWQTLKK